MNRYIEHGLLLDALKGKRVVVISTNRTELRATFQSLAERCSGRAAIRRANGHERITFDNKGVIHFIGAGTSPRGMLADVVFVDGWNDLSEAQRHAIAPMALSSQGELIRA